MSELRTVTKNVRHGVRLTLWRDLWWGWSLSDTSTLVHLPPPAERVSVRVSGVCLHHVRVWGTSLVSSTPADRTYESDPEGPHTDTVSRLEIPGFSLYRGEGPSSWGRGGIGTGGVREGPHHVSPPHLPARGESRGRLLEGSPEHGLILLGTRTSDCRK